MAKARRPYRGLRSNGEIRGIQREHEGPAPSRASLERTRRGISLSCSVMGRTGRIAALSSGPFRLLSSMQISQMGAGIVFWVGEALTFRGDHF